MFKKKSKTDYRYIQYIYIKHDKNVCVLCYNIHLQVCELQWFMQKMCKDITGQNLHWSKTEKKKNIWHNPSALAINT